MLAWVVYVNSRYGIQVILREKNAERPLLTVVYLSDCAVREFQRAAVYDWLGLLCAVQVCGREA